MTVYLVLSGGLCDSIVEAVFSTRERAKEYVDHFEPKVIPRSHPERSIFEMVVDGTPLPKLKWQASMDGLCPGRIRRVRSFVRDWAIPVIPGSLCTYGDTEHEAVDELNQLIEGMP